MSPGSEADLGPAVSVHRARIRVGIMLLVGLGMIALGAYALWFAVTPSTAWGASFLVAGVGLSAFFWPRLWTRVVAYERGLVHFAPRRNRVTRWDEVTAVRFGAVRHIAPARSPLPDETEYSIDVLDGHGDCLKVRHWVAGVDRLARVVHERTFDRLLDEATQKLLSNESVDFGPWVVTRFGVKNPDGGFLPWKDLAAVRVDEGMVELYRAAPHLPSKWSAAPLSTVNNFAVFHALTRRATSSRAGSWP